MNQAEQALKLIHIFQTATNEMTSRMLTDKSLTDEDTKSMREVIFTMILNSFNLIRFCKNPSAYGHCLQKIDQLLLEAGEFAKSLQ